MEVPVVTTPVVADGVRAGGEPPMLIGRSRRTRSPPRSCACCSGPEEHGRLAVDGRAYVEDAFSWPQTVATVEAELRGGGEGAAGDGGPRRRRRPDPRAVPS